MLQFPSSLALALVAAGNTVWLERTQEHSPDPRAGSAMVYDEEHERVVLYGGVSTSTFFDDTWSWDGDAWTDLGVSGPPSRAYAGAAYDAAHNQLVLFGGSESSSTPGNPVHAGDTWLLDGESWAPVGGVTPPPRSSPAMTYDRRNERVVMFGGLGDVGEMADTWLWDGTTWSNVSVPGPLARFGAAMVYSDAEDLVLLYGGMAGTTVYADTWRWDGSSWSVVATDGSPGERTGHGMAFDAERGRAVVFGGTRTERPTRGQQFTKFLGDTWEWDGDSWQEQKATAGPGERTRSAMTYDRDRGRVVLFGGVWSTEMRRDTWEYVGKRSHLSCAAAPSRWIVGLGAAFAWCLARRRKQLRTEGLRQSRFAADRQLG